MRAGRSCGPPNISMCHGQPPTLGPQVCGDGRGRYGRPLKSAPSQPKPHTNGRGAPHRGVAVAPAIGADGDRVSVVDAGLHGARGLGAVPTDRLSHIDIRTGEVIRRDETAPAHSSMSTSRSWAISPTAGAGDSWAKPKDERIAFTELANGAPTTPTTGKPPRKKLLRIRPEPTRAGTPAGPILSKR